MDDMSRLVPLVQLTHLQDLYVFQAGGETAINPTTLLTLDPPLMNWRTSVSLSHFPKREPSGSVSMICFIAFPASLVPPVTWTSFNMTGRKSSKTSSCWVRHY